MRRLVIFLLLLTACGAKRKATKKAKSDTPKMAVLGLAVNYEARRAFSPARIL